MSKMASTETLMTLCRVYEVLKAHPLGFNITNLAHVACINKDTASRYLHCLERLGLIGMMVGRHKNEKIYYAFMNILH